jgi:ketosteroid isomerase-like protein
MTNSGDPAARAMLSRYLAACQALGTEAIAACFSPAAVVRDPTGRFDGRPAIAAYFNGIYAELDELRFETGPVSWCGASCALSWQGAARRKDGEALSYSGIDVFTFDEDGAITELWAFWTPEELLTSDIVG